MSIRCHTTFIVFFVFLLTSQSIAQSTSNNSLDVNAGVSSIDAINAGIRYSSRRFALGINLGTSLPTRGFNDVYTSVSYYRRLWGVSNFTQELPWFIKGGVHYGYAQSELTAGKISDTRQCGARLFLGRDFNLSARAGLTAGVGPIIIFYEQFYNRQQVRPYFQAGVDLMFFYRLGSF